MALVALNRDFFESARGRSRAALAGFTHGQKVMIALALVVAVVAGFAFMRDESKPNYQPLFTNLQASDAGSVTQQLTTAKIPYELADGGSTVLVPAADVDSERVSLAEQGLPDSGTVGFSALEKSGITTSEFVQQVEYQQALEGQLQQTIDSIQGIQSSQVNLVVPQQSDFAIGNQPATTASILVDLTPGTTLTSSQVQAIVHLAASATPGLTSSNVTVADNQGDVLSSPGGTTDGDASSDSQATTAYDNQLSASIEGLLDRVVGVGNSAVQATAVINYNQESTTTQGVQTNSKGQAVVAPTSQTNSTETYSGSGTPPSGVLGSSGTTTSSTDTSGNGTYNTSNTQVTNAVGQVNQTVQQAPGQVEKTSIAVLLNSTTTKHVSVSEVKSLVAAAAGLNPKNGDQLVVTALPFANTSSQSNAALAAQSAAAHKQFIDHAAEIAGMVLLILLMLFFALRAAKRRPTYDEVQVPELASRIAPMLPLDEDSHARGELVLPRSAALAVPDAVLTQVNGYIEQRPAEAAALLRAWAEERTSVAQ